MATRESDIELEIREKLTKSKYQHPYWRFLNKKFNVPIVKSEVTEAAKELQFYVDSGNKEAYRERKQQLEREEGRTFRLTDMQVTETTGIEKYEDIQVAVQVKGHSITWYFYTSTANKDRYPQEFRDILYTSAAEAHQKVERGCDLYYRGSNAFHVKTMHTKEKEAHWNHNHYRMGDNQPVRPEDFRQHMKGFEGTRAMSETTKYGSFFEEGEIDEICLQFEQWYAVWTYKNEEVEEYMYSNEERYMSRPENKLNKVDVIEFYLFGEQQEPCRISVDELTHDYEEARKLIEEQLLVVESKEEKSNDDEELMRELKKLEKEYNAVLEFRKIGGSRGLSSELAMTRQVPHSQLPIVEQVADKDDSLGGVPPIPKWAKNARENMKRTLEIIESSADMKHLDEEELESFRRVAKNVGKDEKLSKVEYKLESRRGTLFDAPSSSGRDSASAREELVKEKGEKKVKKKETETGEKKPFSNF